MTAGWLAGYEEGTLWFRIKQTHSSTYEGLGIRSGQPLYLKCLSPILLDDGTNDPELEDEDPVETHVPPSCHVVIDLSRSFFPQFDFDLFVSDLFARVRAGLDFKWRSQAAQHPPVAEFVEIVEKSECFRSVNSLRCSIKEVAFTSHIMASLPTLHHVYPALDTVLVNHGRIIALPSTSASIAEALPALRVLDLKHNRIEDATGLKTLLQNCHKLESLSLSCNFIQDEVQDFLPAYLPALRCLGLYSNNITQPAAEVAVELCRIAPNLQELWLSGNPCLRTAPANQAGHRPQVF